MNKLKFLSVLFVLSGCAHVLAFDITGNAVDALGEQFVQVSDEFNAALDSGAINTAQYAQFAAFGSKFQAAYPAAVQLWHIAVFTNDDLMQANAIQALTNLAGPLTQFALDVEQAVQLLKATPKPAAPPVTIPVIPLQRSLEGPAKL